MARHFGMALAPWDVMGGGRFQSKKAMEERRKNGEGIRSSLAPPNKQMQKSRLVKH
ncbi:ANE_G0047040.mRNA.1.CDS.1 [Saccharomyces cerevisiae]|nr:AVI_1a_G0047140.mRNA.1.CDS.1 [Saccharomyces cerevisiae]CAI4777488.1 ANE_G0047040.mRNA.1.CDS.1 [Saccharomyces cerevisiae]CAI6868271.1 ANE_G0047040.mRNA.1.CDS.1 [Saccharomyces cerevisiae]CAI7318082.1 AVI_1a_G0047140.mRNA.1.CDS.1 [Saccharomyces cerevisiae]